MENLDHLLLILAVTVLTDTLIHRFHGYARFTWNFVTTTLFTWVFLLAVYGLTGLWFTYTASVVFNIYTARISLKWDASIYEAYLGTVYRRLDE